MVKLLLTGDLHLGKNYQKEELTISEKYKNARIHALENVIEVANKESCDYLVIAGDLYDRTNRIPLSLHKKVCDILSDFNGLAVLIIPGNHDYFNAETDELWNKFEEYSGDNVRLFKKNEKWKNENVIFYPCICHDKHSNENSLGWVKDDNKREKNLIHIGIAHGAVEGLSYDKNQEYYYMTNKELSDCKMDAWLIGHMHTSFPENFDSSIKSRVFNAGTHQQTDIADNSKSVVFILEINEKKEILAKSVKTGVIDFVRRSVNINHGESMVDKLDFSDIEPGRTSLRVDITGTALSDEYDDRINIYSELRTRYIKAEFIDRDLRKEVTAEMINQETLEGSLVNQLLASYSEDIELLNLAFNLVQECKVGK